MHVRIHTGILLNVVLQICLHISRFHAMFPMFTNTLRPDFMTANRERPKGSGVSILTVARVMSDAVGRFGLRPAISISSTYTNNEMSNSLRKHTLCQRSISAKPVERKWASQCFSQSPTESRCPYKSLRSLRSPDGEPRCRPLLLGQLNPHLWTIECRLHARPLGAALFTQMALHERVQTGDLGSNTGRTARRELLRFRPILLVILDIVSLAGRRTLELPSGGNFGEMEVFLHAYVEHPTNMSDGVGSVMFGFLPSALPRIYSCYEG